ncbi:MAG: phenylacetate-CoA oxygenase subunit PaaJ [marine bacterium B5-7]|nr:MAG: phenylacetate-CoA oxygenase subunit PaaJ [marine bacterium B5-7]
MGSTISTEILWEWLESVPDPEIPVLSVVDLGIIRDVEIVDDDSNSHVVITVSPTYSGCPATEVIAGDITSELKRRDIDKVEIKTRIAPPWTTDWITEKGRDKLRRYGIAPPEHLSPGSTPDCPNCNSENTERLSQFGSTPCKALYRCRECLEPFDYFKCL